MQKIAFLAWATVMVLVFAGSFVRATGAGLGCPDWPTCYGQLIPPTSVDQIDFDSLPLEKFKAKVLQAGGNPDLVTAESLRENFNARATWTEYINRLLATPVALVGLLLLVISFASREEFGKAPFLSSVFGMFLILVNAVIGALVVRSSLDSSTITLHMALTMLLLCVNIYTAWTASANRWTLTFSNHRGKLVFLGWVLFSLTIAEGIMGSQVRELTDEMAKSHIGEARELWAEELEQTGIYLAHRSFSWLIFFVALGFGWVARRDLQNGLGLLEKWIVGIVVAQMLLGVTMSFIAVYAPVQIAHVFLSALLVSVEFLWLLGTWRQRPVEAFGAESLAV